VKGLKKTEILDVLEQYVIKMIVWCKYLRHFSYHRRLLRGGWLIIMAGMEQMECINHMETISLMYFILFHSSHYHGTVLPN
jgi:hypothetical protein